ncbi:cation transport protein-domain-containing protein [Truncatella angustata]|uniref:Potassium transport protein n=1 Tax=Truncatella angustata TaxID=152316 RepID=A0A9P9A2U2_9PEZI|nr:cation transport protein-domain-containing protein [Truncatella angustata]KAH6661096.1 cation transport protein-domain-containing protein [Truncatella angustata]
MATVNLKEGAQTVGRWLLTLRPAFLSPNPHFNFITVHYFLIIGMSLLASVLIYGGGKGDLPYIDSLFFASGSNTQAGLNTVDVNLLNTFQQIVIFLSCMVTNPISINSAVVFLRLYWFEKRFQGIVKDARSRRATITKTRSKAKNNTTDLERGVGGRDIRVMHGTAKASRMTNDGILLDDYEMNGTNKPYPGLEQLDSHTQGPPTSPRAIKFSDKVKRSDVVHHDEDAVPIPGQRTEAEHIAILQRQRNEERGTLRIPGPRDAERGVLPEELDDDQFDEDYISPTDQIPHINRITSSQCDSSDPTRVSSNPDGQKTITIAEPQNHPKRAELHDDFEAATKTMSALKFRRPRRNSERLHHTATNDSSHVNPLRRIRTALSHGKHTDPMPYLSWQPTLGRNSEFLDLTEEQREELGGIEYRSLKTLAVITTCYFFGFWIFGVLCLLPWILVNNDYYGSFVDNASQSRVWWGFFTSNSAFMDLGFTLTSDSMNSFNTAIWPLLSMSFLIIIGNTGFPIMLRFCIWVTSLFVSRGSGLWEELRFLLDHPRRCFTLLFPSTATWWLFLILVVLNGLDLILFIILDLGTGAVAELPLNIRFLDGWFQAASTRTAGFSVINLSAIHPAVQTSYLIMMYISVFPIAISVRRTNVYEEKSLGLYGSTQENEERNENGFSYVGAHLRRQLSFDLWYIFIGYFIITISEGPRLMSGDISMFAVLFEIVSAYGTVGLSLGYTGINASLCSQFSVVGKLVIIAMMIRGRHRGLPYGLDRAILLPSESLNRKEVEEAEARLQRRQSAVSLGPRAMSLARGRSRSVERRNVLTSFLHPGPTYPANSISNNEDVTLVRRSSSTAAKVPRAPSSECFQ